MMNICALSSVCLGRFNDEQATYRVPLASLSLFVALSIENSRTLAPEHAAMNGAYSRRPTVMLATALSLSLSRLQELPCARTVGWSARLLMARVSVLSTALLMNELRDTSNLYNACRTARELPSAIEQRHNHSHTLSANVPSHCRCRSCWYRHRHRRRSNPLHCSRSTTADSRVSRDRLPCRP